MGVSPFMAVTILATVCGIVYSAICVCGAWRFLRRTGGALPRFAPGVTILKPLSGLDPDAYECFRSFCLQEYPEFEIIFGVSDQKDAVVPTIQKLMAEFPDRSIRLVVCPESLGSNGKVSSLLQMLPTARYEYLIISDSDIRVPKDYLKRILAPLHNPRVGMVTCMYRGIAGATLGSRLEELGISTDFFPSALAAQQVEGGIYFALGSTMAFHRGILGKIGGLEILADYLADDYELGSRIARAGYEIHLSDLVVEHYLPAYSITSFLEHQLRWARSTRHSRPWGYAGLVLTFALPWALLTLLGSHEARWAWELLGLALALRVATALAVGRAVLGDRRVLRDLWLLPVRDLIAAGVWIVSYFGRQVTWRGQKFELVDRRLRPA